MNRLQLGSYEFDGNTWYLSYQDGRVRCTMTPPENESDDDINGIRGTVDHAALYIDHDPRPPLAEAVSRLPNAGAWLMSVHCCGNCSFGYRLGAYESCPRCNSTLIELLDLAKKPYYRDRVTGKTYRRGIKPDGTKGSLKTFYEQEILNT